MATNALKASAHVRGDLVREFESSGFVVARGLLDSEFVASWGTIAAGVVSKERERMPIHPYHSVIFSIHQLATSHPEFLQFVTAPEPAAFAARLLDGPVLILLDQLLCKSSGGKPTIPHQDAPFLPLGDQPTVNCWIPLSPVDEINGAMVYFRGSHRLPSLGLVHLDGDASQLDPARFGLLPTVVPMEVGDCVFHHGRTIHAAGPNLGTAQRLAISLQFMLEGAIAHPPIHPFMERAGVQPGRPMIDDCFLRPQAFYGRSPQAAR